MEKEGQKCQFFIAFTSIIQGEHEPQAKISSVEEHRISAEIQANMQARSFAYRSADSAEPDVTFGYFSTTDIGVFTPVAIVETGEDGTRTVSPTNKIGVLTDIEFGTLGEVLAVYDEDWEDNENISFEAGELEEAPKDFSSTFFN